MKHPNQTALALHAGGDLGWWARRRTERHVSQCESCRDDVARFRGVREISADLSEIPEIPWNRLAAEMKANIRLGLAAGECVRTEERTLLETPWFTGARAAVAMASVLVLLTAGLILEHPTPALADDGTVVQTTPGGIQMGRGGQAFRLMNTSGGKVTYSLDAQGAIGARSVDPETGYVTINKVYAE